MADSKSPAAELHSLTRSSERSILPAKLWPAQEHCHSGKVGGTEHVAGASIVFSSVFREASILGLSHCHGLHDMRSWDPICLPTDITCCSRAVQRQQGRSHGHPGEVKENNFEISGLKSHLWKEMGGLQGLLLLLFLTALVLVCLVHF